jgi:hypothetical protein
VVSGLNINYFVARTTEGKESNLQVWCALCKHLLKTVEAKNAGAKVDLLEHLPAECSIMELNWLRAYLPPEYRVSEADLAEQVAEDGDGDDGDGDDGDVGDEALADTANFSTRVQLFANLLHSLVLQSSPILFVIEDLHWMDAGSWYLLTLACQWTHGLALVATTRPVPIHMLVHIPNHTRLKR